MKINMKNYMDSTKKSILIADSCAGGLDILKHFLDWAGDYEIFYLADGKNNPLGLKTKKDIEKIVNGWIKYFKKHYKDLALVVIACNTASIAILENLNELKEDYGVPIVTMIDGTKRAIKINSKNVNKKKVLVTGTKYTINSGKYQSLFNEVKPSKIYSLNATKTEKFIARGLENDKNLKKQMLKELSEYKDCNIKAIFLGCTCFEFVKTELKGLYGKNITFLNPAIEVSNKSKNILKPKKKRKSINKVRIYTMGNLKLWEKNINILAKKIFNKKLKVEKIKFD
ncbi:MAG: aspartate/glutamate racemase family protein [Nanoarchaeota archaeon]|nr:aspartate/glutamate racemase family protein [Nanoarchaeota archaeon]